MDNPREGITFRVLAEQTKQYIDKAIDFAERGLYLEVRKELEKALQSISSLARITQNRINYR